jgi:RND family efflux transporter MFP subunit
MNAAIKRRIGFVVTLIICIGVVLLAMAWLSGALRHDQISPGLKVAQAAPVDGEIVVVQATSRPVEADLVGTVESDLRTTIASRLTAIINSINVNAGDSVKKGDILVRLDDRDMQARVAQAQGALRAAESNRDLAQREYDRLRPLVEQKVASPNEADTWRSKYEGAAAEVTRAQRIIEEAEVQLSDTVLKAPFDGIVIDRQTEPGDLASPGKSLLTIYDPSRMRLEANVREAYIGRLDELRKAKQPLAVIVQATGRQVQGMVSQIVPAADPESRSFIVKVQLADPSGLYPGMFGRLRVPMAPEAVLEIPSRAIRDVGQLSFVSVAKEGNVTTRAVRLGASRGGQVEVLAGLGSGERIVLPK